MLNFTTNISAATAITHGGTFHADEVLATVILKKVFPDLIFTRAFVVPENISEDVIVYDIGGGEFDHHQRGGNGCRTNGTPYSSAGLIWKEFGDEIVKNTCDPDLVFKLVDRDLIEPVDAIDNGIKSEKDALSFSKCISLFNPNWDEHHSTDFKFIEAVKFASTVFEHVLANAISTARAQNIVDKAIENSENKIMVLDRFVPWQEAIFSSDNKKAESILFVIFPSNRGVYNIQCVPTTLNGYDQRKPVPSSWRGLKDTELQKVTKVKTATFCHNSGFISACETLEDAMKLAKKAIKA